MTETFLGLELLDALVNVISTASIAHHYLLPSRPFPASSPSSEHDLDPRSPSRVVLQENGRQDVGAADGLDGFLKASILWLRWPARSSLFQPASRSANYAQQLSEPPRTDTDPDPDGRSPVPYPPSPTEHEDRGAIHRLMQSPVLYDPLRAPRFPIVLCHGLYGFDVRGPPSLRMQYWSSILGILRKIVGAEVIVTAVPGTGSIASRAEQLDRFLQAKAPGRGINFMAHSMGGLDCRHLITHLKPVEYAPLSLTTIATPHRGSPFMDWCKDYLGLGRRRPEDDEERRSTMTTIDAIDTTAEQVRSQTLSLSSLPSSFTTFLLGLFDSPAYANLTTSYLTETFNPRYARRPPRALFQHRGTHDSAQHLAPALVPQSRARQRSSRHRHGQATTGADHWALRGASGIELDVDPWGFAVDWRRALGIRRDHKTPTTTTKEATKDEAALRSSTDRLSAVVDWLVEQVPVASRGGFSFAGAPATDSSPAGSSPQWHLPSSASAAPKPKPKPRGDLESTGDLERLYVALARKLYDEGL
ncbi:alpha/beta-hydrolase [Lactarius indigo]|nr:alpha/beta-hydrolase [Lactarius indigo]